MQARPHTEECRERIEEALKRENNHRYTRHKEAADQAVWEEIQRQERQRERAGNKEKDEGPEARGETTIGDETQRPGTQGDGQTASSSSCTGGEHRKRSQEGSGESQEHRAKKIRKGAKRPLPEGEEAQRNKAPREGEEKGTKREGDQAQEERQAVRQRTQESGDPADTEMTNYLMNIDVKEGCATTKVTEEAKSMG